jgi:hypothetical protein
MTAKEVNDSIAKWLTGVSGVSRHCEVLLQPFYSNRPPQHLIKNAPFKNFEYQWMVFINFSQLLNFGFCEDELGSVSFLHYAIVYHESDNVDLIELPASKWSISRIPLSTVEQLENELLERRWYLELDEPDWTLDPRPFLVSEKERYILTSANEILEKMLYQNCKNKLEIIFLESFISITKSLADLSGVPDYINNDGLKYYAKKSKINISGKIHFDFFSFEINPAIIIFDYDDLGNTDWKLERGNINDVSECEMSAIIENLREWAKVDKFEDVDISVY